MDVYCEAPKVTERQIDCCSAVGSECHAQGDQVRLASQITYRFHTLLILTITL